MAAGMGTCFGLFFDRADEDTILLVISLCNIIIDIKNMARVDGPAARQRLMALHAQIGRVLESLSTLFPTFAGVVYRLRTRCGKPQCICTEGELHSAWCVSYLDRGQRRLRSVPEHARESLQASAGRYRQLRADRAQINRLFRELLRVFDRLERSLRLSASRALPRAKRGR